MKNLKVHVNSVEESKEVQELFFELGLKKILPDIVCFSGDVKAVCAIGGFVWINSISFDSCSENLKEITIPQLKDIVILKRNDPNDANVYQDGNIPCLYELYLTNDGVLYFYHHGKKEWILSNLNGDEDYYKLLKPITKEKTFKEYLQKLDDGSYKLVVLDSIVDGHDGLIEVPDGATYYAIDSNLGIKKNYFFRCPNDAIWVESQWMKAGFSVSYQTVLWQRHTQPEELPFIDDDPKHDNVNHPSHYTNGKVECIDALESATVGKSGIEAVCTANIIKYLWRYEDKNGLEDVEKAQWYLSKLLDVLKNK